MAVKTVPLEYGSVVLVLRMPAKNAWSPDDVATRLPFASEPQPATTFVVAPWPPLDEIVVWSRSWWEPVFASQTTWRPPALRASCA